MKKIIKCILAIVVGHYDQSVRDTAQETRSNLECINILAGGNLQQPGAVIWLAREKLIKELWKWQWHWTVNN